MNVDLIIASTANTNPVGALLGIVVPAVAVIVVVLLLSRTIKDVLQEGGRSRTTRKKCRPKRDLPRERLWEDMEASAKELADIVGEEGELAVRERLWRLPLDSFIVMNDVWLPLDGGSETQIDHVVVSTYGIFVIETKNWKGVIYADAKSAVWTKFNRGHKEKFKNPIRQNYKHLIAIKEKFFRPGDDFVFGVVTMSGLAVFRYGVPEGVVYYDDLVAWVLSHNMPCIKPEQVPEIADAILEWSATVSEDVRARHCGHFL